jgi:hypothetical protein
MTLAPDNMNPRARLGAVVEQIADEVVLGWMMPAADVALGQQEREALDAGAETGEVADAIGRSRAAMVKRSRDGLLAFLVEAARKAGWTAG